MRMWSADNPHFFRETPLHPLKIGVWVGMSRRRLIGPIFFEDSVTAKRYRNNILDVFINQLHDDKLTHGYFQQDGATAHTTRETLDYLRQFFDDTLISRDLWPTRSPDLTPLDYYLFSHLKNTIFKEPVHTIDDLKIIINTYIVNYELELCTCYIGNRGAPCKHPFAVINKLKLVSPQFHPTLVDTYLKELLHLVIHGTQCQV
jgi:hypothetical protein